MGIHRKEKPMRIFRIVLNTLRNSNCSRPNYNRRRRQAIANARRRQPVISYATSARDGYVHDYKAICKYCKKYWIGSDTEATMIKAIECEHAHKQFVKEALDSLNF